MSSSPSVPLVSSLVLAASIALVFSPTPLDAQQSPSARSPRARPAISLTGCLRRDDDNSRAFLLTNATRPDDDEDQGDRPPASSSSSSSSSSIGEKGEGRSYRLVPLGAKVDLKSHVGEKVEIGGRFTDTDEPHTTSKDTHGKDNASATGGSAPTIAVAYVRTVAPSCGATAGSQP